MPIVIEIGDLSFVLRKVLWYYCKTMS